MDSSLKRFFGNERAWKNPEGRTTDKSTYTFVDRYHEEEIGSVGFFKAYISHCRTPNGKGFKGSVRSVGSGHSTNFYKGTSQELYDWVKKITLELMNEAYQELTSPPTISGKK